MHYIVVNRYYQIITPIVSLHVGSVAEGLGNGLQNRLYGFESRRYLYWQKPTTWTVAVPIVKPEPIEEFTHLMTSDNISESARKRQEAREAAQKVSKKAERKNRGRKVAIQGALASVAVLAISGVALFVSSLDIQVPSGPVDGPANMASGGVVLEAGKQVRASGSYRSDELPVATVVEESDAPHVTIFADYTCPACKGFEEFYGDFLSEKLAAEEITLEYQIIAFRDAATAGTRYSTRSANAALCVVDAEPEAFPAFHEALYRNQPTTGAKPELTNDELVALASSSGVTDENAISECINGENFTPWVKANTTRALEDGPLPVQDANLPTIQGTPTVFINGTQFLGTSIPDFEAALAAAQ